MYSILREFADSWVLLLMFLFFVGVFVWVFRPGSKKVHSDTADIPFRHEDSPLADAPQNAQNKEA
ncbi:MULTISPECIES: cbb3-type cytochrome c oxidase subunit 3 [Halocynthiibacter]|uniref:Cbb3-type cytochrome c oxidase subunit 3 n=1 Tax=Halocynthiibacter halioticoli TaxID=2986804 RepID=A0AAE3IYN8_9RHOB|nr:MULTISPECIES: cbb3-type cytochrome c oxidase subunit 3 [Halocynthiibacter]MCV6823343.1 cbb3-type cytochrome c oxidase subunit 3 [Halocynthiibacter halioticoli]MCW4056344.1 cbb3-type cytochrome c oxidase subunit 3 [Halocynthiibacter sp. SDUM655004]MDE0590690.1 cbb3-type cytochrome c oxidase subunit 3 [Halocynthiibacter sp. C4]